MQAVDRAAAVDVTFREACGYAEEVRCAVKASGAVLRKDNGVNMKGSVG